MFRFKDLRSKERTERSSKNLNRVKSRSIVDSAFLDPTALSSYLSVLGGLSSAATLGVLYNRYKISKPDEYLVKTGLFVPDVQIFKTTFLWPLQECLVINMRPSNYTFELHAMSSEKINFLLPIVFTIGPQSDLDSLEKYAKNFVSAESIEKRNLIIENLIKDSLEGETRLQLAIMTIEQIFNDRIAFKEILIKGIQSRLDVFGLKVYNANIKELQDSGSDSQYFAFLRKKKISEAENSAKIDVAEANKKGSIGEKERLALARQQMALFEAQAVQQENERQQEIEKSNAELEVVRSEASKKIQIAKIEADQASKLKDTEWQRQIEQARISTETEKLRATEMSKAQVEAEATIKKAEGTANALKLEADASLYSKQKEAEGIYSLYSAQSKGIKELVASFSGEAAMIQFMMIEKRMYEELAKTNAEAIKGLNPKITIWNTSDGKDTGYTKPIADIMKMLPPLISTINDQTGISPPKWLMDLEDKKEDKL